MFLTSEKIQFECQGLINQHSNMFAPQGSEYEGKMKRDMVWPVVRTRNQRENSKKYKTSGETLDRKMSLLLHKLASSNDKPPFIAISNDEKDEEVTGQDNLSKVTGNS